MTKRNDRHLTMAELVGRIDAGEIDTVVVAFTDMQGRLQGKRLHGRYFADVVVEHGTEGCGRSTSRWLASWTSSMKARLTPAL